MGIKDAKIAVQNAHLAVAEAVKKIKEDLPPALERVVKELQGIGQTSPAYSEDEYLELYRDVALLNASLNFLRVNTLGVKPIALTSHSDLIAKVLHLGIEAKKNQAANGTPSNPS